MSSPDHTPELSVVLPVFNAERYIAEAIASVLRQTYRNFELIVIDDGSSDGSAAIIDALAADDARIRAFHQANAGLIATLNRGIGLAGAPFVARMDADDVSLPRRFEMQMSRFRNRAELAVVGGFVNIVDEKGRFVRLGDYPLGGSALVDFLEQGCPVAHPSVIMRKCIVDAVGGYRPLFAYAEDYDLWLRIHDAGYLIENVGEAVMDYRQHGETVSTRHREQQELATLVARLAHRARRAGLADPTAKLTAIDEATIELFPAELRRELEAERFALKYRELSLLDAGAIDAALAQYRRLPKGVMASAALTHFLLRASRGLWANRRYRDALACFWQAFRAEPALTSKLASEKVGRLGG